MRKTMRVHDYDYTVVERSELANGHDIVVRAEKKLGDPGDTLRDRLVWGEIVDVERAKKDWRHRIRAMDPQLLTDLWTIGPALTPHKSSQRVRQRRARKERAV